MPDKGSEGPDRRLVQLESDNRKLMDKLKDVLVENETAQLRVKKLEAEAVSLNNEIGRLEKEREDLRNIHERLMRKTNRLEDSERMHKSKVEELERIRDELALEVTNAKARIGTLENTESGRLLEDLKRVAGECLTYKGRIADLTEQRDGLLKQRDEYSATIETLRAERDNREDGMLNAVSKLDTDTHQFEAKLSKVTHERDILYTLLRDVLKRATEPVVSAIPDSGE